MDGEAFPGDSERIALAFRTRLSHCESCPELLDAGEALLHSVWQSSAQLLGEVGARAVLARSIRAAGRRSTLAASIRATDRGVDMGATRSQALSAPCARDEVLDALVLVGVAVFGTLEQLTGTVISKPLLRSIEDGRI